MSLSPGIHDSLAEAIRAAYRSGQEDEALEPIVKVDSSGRPIGKISKGDSLIFYDIRGEREVELTESLTDPCFSHFPAKKLDLNYVTLIEYSKALNVKVAFPPEDHLKNTLTEVFGGAAGFRVVKISESEKAIHVGYFFNGKSEDVFPCEERVVVPSPQVADYAAVPDMSAAGVATAVEQALARDGRIFVLANLANVDVVGHIEDKGAVLAAVEAVDQTLGRIIEAARREKAALIVTADHGTVEEWLYPDGTVNTGHTKNPVPFILADFSGIEDGPVSLMPAGELADVAPTLLRLAGIAVPPEMTGRNLVEATGNPGRPRTRVLLLILDGWGRREDAFGNMIVEALTPRFDELWASFPHSTLDSFGEAVGMPRGTVGNSEAGHLHLGAGRRVLLDRVKIDKAIEDGSFFRNEVFLRAAEMARKNDKTLHLMGIVSHYSSHGTIKHLFALLRLAREAGVKKVFVHSFIGRRGERPESGVLYVEKVEETCRDLGVGEVVTVMGRFWSLDREENWDRIEKAYRALVEGAGTKVRRSGPIGRS
ncbi:MAG: alkaline phosphatase family protein [Candidatus Aminicenantes bacterium]|nr:alkaline phosphatase family protein [Candidatus Aminicenantes bacterium]